MSYSASFQLKGLLNCQISKFDVRKNGVAPGPKSNQIYLIKSALNPKCHFIFFKSQTLTLGSFAAL